MRRASGILFAVVLVALMAGSVFAEEQMEEKGAQSSMMSGMHGMMGGQGMMGGSSGMMNMPMMQNMMDMMGGQGMMGQGMMSGGMMCPMCGRMMGEKGMMSGGMMQDMMGTKPHIEGMAAALDLSKEQQSELRDLHTAYKKDMIRKKADREIAEIDLQELIEQDDPDLDAVEEQLREIASLEAQTKYAWVKLLVDAKSLLTEKQKAEFKKLMKGKKGPMMMGQMMGGKKAEADKPAPKAEFSGHEEHH